MRIPRRFATKRREPDADRLPWRGLTPLRWITERLPANTDRRFMALGLGVFAAALGAGYLMAALVLFPAPIFAASSNIPSVRGLTLEEAGERLAQRGFRFSDQGRVQHPDLPVGSVVWQDPPPDVVAPEGTTVQINTSAGPQRVAVPDVAGYDVQLARTLLEAAGLTVGGIESAPAPTPANVAVNTRPPAGSTLPPGARVTLVVSVGQASIRIPDLRGRTIEEARQLLDSLSLALGEYYMRTDPTAVPGTIIFQRPDVGTLAAPGAAVEVRIARRADP